MNSQSEEPPKTLVAKIFVIKIFKIIVAFGILIAGSWVLSIVVKYYVKYVKLLPQYVPISGADTDFELIFSATMILIATIELIIIFLGGLLFLWDEAYHEAQS